MLDNIPAGLGWVLVGIGAIVFVLVVRRFRTQAHRLQERSRELEHLSTELIRVNKMKSEFLANVSHELRTPLNAIVGFVDLLREGVYGELTPKQAGPVQRIEASASHLRHLVDQILDLAKIAAGRLEVHSEPIDLRPFILDVASEVEPLVSEKSLYLSLALSSALPRVRTDPTHLRQIVLNLLGNAVKYTHKGTISVRTRMIPASDASIPATVKSVQDVSLTVGRPWVAILVSDTGIGIGKNDQARIFEEFEQINAGPRGDS
ncbi:MAG TPA: HAMP domain-containing sensor histidine kinase, partial [Terriglobales bacterium]|nr:HAMP domain-containing sensor histidine kinase [Terriglobales bacterium]